MLSKAPWVLIGFAFGAMVVLLLVLVQKVCIFKQQRHKRRPIIIHRNGAGPPRDENYYTNLNNSNQRNYDHELLNMDHVA